MTRSVWVLAMLFCTAIIFYEIYIELKIYHWSRYSIAFYLAFAFAALVVYDWAKRRSIQADAEN